MTLTDPTTAQQVQIYGPKDQARDIAWLVARGFTFWQCDTESPDLSRRTVLVPSAPEQATLVSSNRGDYMHLPALDLDWNADDRVGNPLVTYGIQGDYLLVPSSTPGHWHLFVDQSLTWREYSGLLDQLRKTGFITEGYAWLCTHMRQSMVRVPGRFKTGVGSFYDTTPWPRAART
jgi:hypothetical protein